MKRRRMRNPARRGLTAAGMPAGTAVLFFLFCIAAALLAGCLFDRPLIAPGNAYDPRLALVQDSLTRFDTVEIRLMDPDDPSVSLLLWKGPPGATDTLPPHLAGDGQTLVYLVHGYRIDRGRCFTERITRQGDATVLIDSCAVKPPIPDPDPGPLPRFVLDTLDFGKKDSSLFLTLSDFPDTGKARYTLESSVKWIFFHPGRRDVGVRVDRTALPVGLHSGHVVLTTEFPDSKDTVIIIMTVPKPMADIRGTLVDWRDSLPQSGFTIVLDGTQSKKVQSDSNGSFAFPEVDLGRHVLAVTGPGRIGRVDTFTIAAEGRFLRTVAVAPARAFTAVNLGWSRHAGRTAVAGGQGVVVSTEFDQRGMVAAFPLDNSSPSLQRIFPQGNSDGEPDFAEYYEAGEVAADSQAIFIAYPDASRLGRIGNWRTVPETLSVAVPIQPGALLLHGSSLFVLGRLADSTLALGEWNSADLSLIRVDTLTGFPWDGTLPDWCVPQMAVWNGSIYAVDGNGPGVKGNVLRIGLESRKVLDSRQTTDAMLAGLAIHGGRIYVTSMSSTGKAIRIFDPKLFETGQIDVGTNTGRIAFVTEGSMQGYGFVATDSNAILVIHPLAKQSLGTLSLPGSLPARSLSVDGRSGTVLVSDGDKLHSIRF